MSQADEDAIGWLLRLREGQAADWARFTEWLEASPAHAEAYARSALIDAEAAEALAVGARRRDPVLAPPSVSATALPSPRAASRRRWMGSGIAAALIAAVGGVTMLTQGEAVYAVTTAPGEQRSLALADGTRVDLNGDSKLLLDHHDARRVELARGEASFAVHHDADAPFEVRAGDSRVRDIGTRFDVKRRDGITEVAVAEGSVLYNPHREAIRLVAGDRLRDRDGPTVIERSHIAAASVGSWRSGRLSFEDEPLTRVAAELSAASGARLTVAPAIAERRFTGVILIGRDRTALMRRLPPLLDVAAIRDGNGWRLVASDSAAR